MLLGYGNSIEKLGIDIIDNLASLPPVSVFGLLLMVISFGGIALQMANICKYILVIWWKVFEIIVNIDLYILSDN